MLNFIYKNTLLDMRDFWAIYAFEEEFKKNLMNLTIATEEDKNIYRHLLNWWSSQKIWLMIYLLIKNFTNKKLF